jgi:hypothetical protein
MGQCISFVFVEGGHAISWCRHVLQSRRIEEISNFHNLVHSTKKIGSDALLLICFFIGLIHYNNNIWKAQVL